RMTRQTLEGMDDGELFLQHGVSESLSFDDRVLKNASFNTVRGFGLRSVLGETTGYAHSSEISKEALARAASVVRAVQGKPFAGALTPSPVPVNVRRYGEENPVDALPFIEKVALL